jgi:hypothetical protein
MGNYLPRSIFGYQRQEIIDFFNKVIIVIVTAIVAVASTLEKKGVTRNL